MARIPLLGMLLSFSIFINNIAFAMQGSGLFGEMVSKAVQTPSPVVCQSTCPNFIDIVAKVGPAVVNISTSKKITRHQRSRALRDAPNLFDFFDLLDREFGERQERQAKSLGSGFIIDASGLVVTNYHVVAGADQIEVVLGSAESSKKYKAKLVSKDAKTDIALLKIEAGDHSFPYLEFGDSDKAEVGGWVLAIGNPYGLGGTVTKGIISAKSRTLNELGIGQLSEYIQTDAPINRGNSGGPMIDINGKVIGMNSVIITQSGGSVGLGFAIPSNLMRSVIKELRQNGVVKRSWLGVMVQALEDEAAAKSMGLSKSMGALVAEVTPDSPADKAGLKPGDVIIKFNNVTVVSSGKLPILVSETRAGSVVPVEIWRHGKTVNVSVKLALMPEEDSGGEAADKDGDKEDSKQASKSQCEFLGITMNDISSGMRAKYNIPKNVSGAIVTKVDEAKIINSMGPMVKPGDVVMQINQMQVRSVQDAQRAANMLKAEEEAAALLLVFSGGRSFFTLITLLEK